MIMIAVPVHILAFIFYIRTRDLASLSCWALIALAIGLVIPLAFVVSWALMDRAKRKEGFEKIDSFDKKFDEDWDNED